MIKFHNGRVALDFWYLFMEATQDFGMPSMPLAMEELFMAEETYKNWDYPEWFYVWVELDKRVSKLNEKDKLIITSFYKDVYHYGTSKSYYTWKHHKQWSGVCRRFFALLPGEMKKGAKGERG